MVLQRRLSYGYNGSQAPFVPRRPRSARGKRSSRKRIMETQMCAFDLLATVAGNLLLEENSPTPVNIAARDSIPSFPKVTVKEEQQDEGGASKVGPCDQESCHEGARPVEHVFQRQMPLLALKTHSQASSSAGLSPESISVKLDPSEEVASAEESVYKRNRVGSGRILGTKSPVLAGVHQPKVEEGIPSPFQFRGQKSKGGFPVHTSDPCCSELPMKVDFKPPLWSSESSIEVPVDGDSRTPHSSCFLKSRHDMKHFTVDRYDEDISSARNLPRCVPTKSSRSQRFGDRRIRKLLASKFWKVGPTVLKAKEFSHKDEGVKPIFRSKKMCYTRHRTQGCSFKRRKLFERGLASTCEGTIISEGSAEIGNKRELCCSAEKASAVKLSIESFKVPELFVELPETATIGCLKAMIDPFLWNWELFPSGLWDTAENFYLPVPLSVPMRTVVEAVTAVLCGGFRIGVVLQGKKLRDDNKTLLQAGISLDDKLDDLGFTLEPKPSQASSNLTANTEDSHFLSGCSDSEPPRRLSAAPASDTVMLDACTDPPPPPPAASENCVENNHRYSSAPAPAGTVPAEKSTSDSKALVVVPPMEVEALAVVPFHRKPRRPEATPRRVRRPFSVSEVEALVQAVEMLGTGRWRDVKLRAFENAKHRTYVDLKDKWKTLVHTAKISPQQRRGEPVPQELLDRVLSANAYWSQHHAKLQVKQPPPSEQLLLA